MPAIFPGAGSGGGGDFSTADDAKLDGIEASATADQTGAEIKALYEGESDTNAFTDANVTKLANTQTVLSSTLAADASAVDGTTPVKVMTGPSLAANTKYSIQGCVHYTSGSSSDGNISLQGPSGCSGGWHQDLDADQVPISPASSANTITINGAGGSTAQIAFFIGFVTTSSTAGTLHLYVAENVDGSTDFVMKAGTYIVCTELKTAP